MASLAGLPPVVTTTVAIPHSRLGVNKVRNEHDGNDGTSEPPREIRKELEKQNAAEMELYAVARARLKGQLAAFRKTRDSRRR